MRAILSWFPTMFLAVAIFVGCFSPDYGQQPFTCPDGACPSGYVCSRGVCETEASEKDAGVDRHEVIPDAPWPDDLPMVVVLPVRISETTTGSTAECQAEEFAVGGGVSCTSHVQSSKKTTSGHWTGACTDDEIPTKVSAYCVQRPALSGFNAPVKIDTPTATAQCNPADISPAENFVLVGGSCHCKTGTITASTAIENTESWTCECDAGEAVAAAHCVSFEVSSAIGLLRDHEFISEARDTSLAICPPDFAVIGGGCGDGLSTGAVGFTRMGNCVGPACFECSPASTTTIFCVYADADVPPPDVPHQ